MTDVPGARCLQCGELIHEDEHGWICRGCDVRVDRNGRRLRTQPSKAEKARRRMAQPSLFEAADRRALPEVGRAIPNFDDPPPTRFTARVKKRRKLWCRPCDRLFVMRNRKPTCWACGVIYDPKVA